MQTAVARDVLTFGVVPQQSATTLAKVWTPIMNYLGQHSNLDIQFRTAPDIPTFEQRLAAGEYDVAYMNPYHFVVFSERPGYTAVTRARDKTIKGIIVVRKDSDISELSDLDKNTLAFPAPAAFAASILPRAELAARGISFEPSYVSSHDSVYLAVSRGLYLAGGGVMRTFLNAPPEVRNQLRILWTTEGYTPHAIAALPSVAPQTLEKLRQGLLSMEQDETGRTLLESLKIKGFEPARDSDWDDVRRLNISTPGSIGTTGKP